MKGKQVDDGQFDTLKDSVIQAMQGKKAFNIVSIDLKKLNNPLADMFIICHGSSDRHVETIAKSVEEHVKKQLAETPWLREGFENKEWILLDYFDIVVHIFLEEKRDFFGLEELWGDGEIVAYESEISSFNEL